MAETTASAGRAKSLALDRDTLRQILAAAGLVLPDTRYLGTGGMGLVVPGIQSVTPKCRVAPASQGEPWRARVWAEGFSVWYPFERAFAPKIYGKILESEPRPAEPLPADAVQTDDANPCTGAFSFNAAHPLVCDCPAGNRPLWLAVWLKFDKPYLPHAYLLKQRFQFACRDLAEC